MFYRQDIFDELGLAAPTSWDEVIAAGTAIRESGKDIEPLALYYHNDGNRQNLFIWLNYLWSVRRRRVRRELQADLGLGEAGIQATKDYIALHTEHKVTNPASLSFVEQDARQSIHPGQLRDDPGLVVGLFADDQPGKLDAHQGTGGVHRASDLSGPLRHLRDLHAVLDLQLFREPGSRLGVPEVALEPRDGEGERDRTRGRRQADRQQCRDPYLEPPGSRM